MDNILMSEVMHLIPHDNDSLIDSFDHLLNDDGAVLIRTSTLNQLTNREWYEYFPGSLEIDLRRHWDLDELINSATNRGYFVRNIEVNESRYVPTLEYIRWFEEKCYSTMRLISEDVVKAGVTHLRRKIGTGEMAWHDYRMTAIILRKVK
jgi:hypothetical protein